MTSAATLNLLLGGLLTGLILSDLLQWYYGV